MRPLTGALDTLSDDIILDSGVVFIGDSPVGLIRGGVSFDPGRELRNVEYDGKRSNVAELDRIVGFMPKLSFTMIELGHTATGDQVALLEPGSTEAADPDDAAVSVVTPKTAGAPFASGDYTADLVLVFERLGSGYEAIRFPVALCTKYSVKGQDKNEAGIDCEFEARLAKADAIATPGKCPYVIERRATLPS